MSKDAPTVAALYVCKCGPYVDMPGVDVWTEDRDAMQYNGPWPVVAHPPCAPWSFQRNFRLALYRPGRSAEGRDPHKYTPCGPRAVEQVRAFGGVLEHPAFSALWAHCDMPRPGELPDRFGGFTVEIYQSAWGHKAPKRTWLYFCHTTAPFNARTKIEAASRMERMWSTERHLTPPALARELVDAARSVSIPVDRHRTELIPA